VWNQDVVDNPIELRGGGIAVTSQTTNDILYASSSSQLARSANLTFDGTDLLSTGQIDLSTVAPATPTMGRMYADSICRAWVSVTNSGTPTIEDDFNVASLTDNGLGDVTVNFATNIGSATYAAVATVLDVEPVESQIAVSARATGSVTVDTEASSGARADRNFCLIVMGV